MDANGGRFHALVTKADWLAHAPDGDWGWLPDDPAHEDALGQLVLKPALYEFKASGASALPEPTSRAGGAFDRYGNLYSLSTDGTRIRVWSSGSGLLTTFWPLPQAAEAPAVAGGFGPCDPVIAEPLVMDALTVTTGHYLVVASVAAGGLLIFDLHGGGPPLPQPWAGMPAPQALLALDDGGVALFGASRLHRLGADLRPCVPRTAGPAVFMPAPPPAAPPVLEEPAPLLPAGPPCQLELGADATAVAALPGGRFVVLRRQADGSRLSVIDAAGLESAAVGPLEQQIQANTVGHVSTALSSATLAVEWPAEAGGEGFGVLLLAASGDQAFRFAAAEPVSGTWQFTLQQDFIPLRRYVAGGLAALAAGQVLHRFSSARVFYAGADRWLPLLTLPRPRCLRDGTLTGPVWDSGTPGCVWHRVALDARRPPGSTLTLQSRTAETPEALQLQPWRDEPRLQPHPCGPELPWREPAVTACKEVQTLTCLLQAATGRYLQLRLQAGSDGQHSLGLASLRAWYPRFSYLQHYLPAVYRADAASAAFTERFLALFEGELTRWEDRIAAAQLLLDARTAPRETLDWLAGWLAVGFDGSTGLARRRALLRHATTAHARRGTVPGMLLAATLAWEHDSVDVEPFLAAPEALADRVHGVRLQELFGLAPPLAAQAWRPARGGGDLLARLGGVDALVVGQRTAALRMALGFVPRAATEEAGHVLPSGDALLGDAVLGEAQAAPALPADSPDNAAGLQALRDHLQATRVQAPLRTRWQRFLQQRWGTLPAMNAAWSSHWAAWADIPVPTQLPASDAELLDWAQFEHQTALAGGAVLPATAWQPAQGGAALRARLVPIAGLGADGADATLLQSALGFLPRGAQEEAALMASWRLAELPDDEPQPRNEAFDDYLAATRPCAPLRQRWQDYLARRWRRISLLNAAWGTGWRSFDRIPSPLRLPAGSVALADWWRFEAQIVRALTPAHRFRIVLPLPADTSSLDFDELARRRAAVERAVELDKPAHTVAEIRFGFELFRVGEARLGHDTRLEQGLARRPELAALTADSIWPPLVLGERDLGGGQLTHPRPLPPPDRVGLDR